MPRPGIHLALLALLLPLQCAHRAAVQRDPRDHGPPVTLRPLVAGVWVHTSYARLPEVGWFPSSGLLIESPGALLLVDTAWGLDATRELFGLIRARFGRLPSAALVTHAHDDRVGGLPLLREAHVRVYATAATAAIIASHGHGSIDTTLASPVDAGALAAVEVFSPGAAHTPDNVVVWIPSARVLFGGCMIRPAGARSLGNLDDADLASWPASALRVEDRYREAAIVVPSHGEPGDVSLLAQTVALAHAALTDDTPLRRVEHLPLRDGATATVCGTYERFNALASQGGDAASWRDAIRVEGDERPRLFVDGAGDLSAMEGQRVCARGVFHPEEPLHPGDPSYASRRSGWWLSEARVRAQSR